MLIQDKFNRPLNDLRISLIDRCNFRCPYCMPSEKFHHHYEFLNKNEWLSFDEIIRLVKVFVKCGVKKIRLTGGEPLLRPDIDVLIKAIVKVEGVEDLALTTNGSLLADIAPRLKAAGLKRLTVSLDSLDPQVLKIMSGERGNVDDVLHGINAAQAAGFKNIKINAVIKRGVNDHTILDLVRYSRQTGHVVRFIEYMDVGNQNSWKQEHVVSTDEIVKIINSQYPIVQVDDTKGGETSERFSFKDGQGEIGFISSVSHAFCGTCNRLRLSADGKMYTCLFATHGTDLRALVRNRRDDEGIENIIRTTWLKRTDRYSELRSQLTDTLTVPKVEMYHIGG